jgi:chromosome partitioning protein
MIVVLAGLKGGTGKSTLAVNLAAHRASLGKRVLLVDSDKQGSAWYWHRVRLLEGVVLTIECVQIFSRWLGVEVRCLATHYDDVIVDTRSNEDPATRSAMLVADRLITPLDPWNLRMQALPEMDAIVAHALSSNEALQACALINRAPTHPGSNGTEQLLEMVPMLKHYRPMRALLRDRKAFRRCGSEGRSVGELSCEDKSATAEMLVLAREVWENPANGRLHALASHSSALNTGGGPTGR